jgi:hypothetical protein
LSGFTESTATARYAFSGIAVTLLIRGDSLKALTLTGGRRNESVL